MYAARQNHVSGHDDITGLRQLFVISGALFINHSHLI